MKKSVLFSMIIALVATLSFSANAQDKKEQKRKFNAEQMVQHRAEMMAQKLQLDDATASKFTTTYKEYLKEMHNIYKQNAPKNGFKGRGVGPQVRKTDAEVEQEIMNQFAMSRSIIDVREKYYKKFRTFLNPQQIQKIYSQEREHASNMKWEKGRRNANGKHDKRPGGQDGKMKKRTPKQEDKD